MSGEKQTVVIPVVFDKDKGNLEKLHRKQKIQGSIEIITEDMSFAGFTDSPVRSFYCTESGVEKLGLESQTMFDDKWAEALSELLKEGEILHSINITGSSITHEGAKMLAEALKTNQKVQLFNFRGNSNIGDEGVKAIADMLVENQALKKVYLGSGLNITAATEDYFWQKVEERESKYPSLSHAKIVLDNFTIVNEQPKLTT